MKVRSALPVLLCFALMSSAASAQPPMAPADPATTPAAMEPRGADHPAVANTGAAAPAEPITRKWWFWTALTAVVMAGAVVAIIATRPPSAPRTTLGNMDAFGKP